jgi:hypothetical protein
MESGLDGVLVRHLKPLLGLSQHLDQRIHYVGDLHELHSSAAACILTSRLGAREVSNT